MNNPTDKAETSSAFQQMAEEARRICGDDPHREGVPAQIMALMREAFKNPDVRADALQGLKTSRDIFGSNAQPGFGIMGVESKEIGYREPHDHENCWAVNVQVRGDMRLVHWVRDSVDEETGDIVLRKVDEVTMHAGDVDFSAPGIAHELYPLTDDSVELAVRCHSLTEIIQHRYDRSTGEYINWSWGNKEAVGGGKFTTVNAENEPAPLSAMISRIK
ncbi:MAG: hypothetical protein DRQ54_04405 [Gammaproteobacteria bacterium]|nr:MAG: hypothetical protein DRQ54_04405 [Gammaproteobacteria bacterium]RLA14351.1 MAG: hypothetical protein DRQ52_04415 [Gammaproteobacteria bacterium]